MKLHLLYPWHNGISSPSDFSLYFAPSDLPSCCCCWSCYVWEFTKGLYVCVWKFNFVLKWSSNMKNNKKPHIITRANINTKKMKNLIFHSQNYQKQHKQTLEVFLSYTTFYSSICCRCFFHHYNESRVTQGKIWCKEINTDLNIMCGV